MVLTSFYHLVIIHLPQQQAAPGQQVARDGQPGIDQPPTPRLNNPTPADQPSGNSGQLAAPFEGKWAHSCSVMQREAMWPRTATHHPAGALRWAQQLPVSAQKRGTPAPIWGSERCLAQILICKAQPVRSERRGAHSLGDPTSHRQR